MFEQVAEGFVGLFLFVSNWLSPGATQEDVRIAAIKTLSGGYRIECAISIAWNEQMSDIVDAGIPLRFRMSAWSDARDTAVFIRTLRCDISTYSYIFTDTVLTAGRDSVRVSRTYSQVLMAMRDYTRWNVDVGGTAASCRIQAELLPSRAAQLNRVVDMSNICGCRNFSRTIVLSEPDRPARRR